MKKSYFIFGIAVIIIILFIVILVFGKSKNAHGIAPETAVNQENMVEDSSEQSVIENDTEVYMFEEN